MAWRRPAGDGELRSQAPLRRVPAGPAERPAPTESVRAGVIVGRRRTLPGGRAALGGLFVAAAAVVVFAAALSAAGGRGHPYVVAARDLPAGTVIGPGDTTTETMTLPAGVAGQSFRSGGDLIGRRLAVGVAPGSLVETTMLAPAGGSGLRPVSIAVDPDSLADLAPGEAVDVLESTAGSALPAGTGTPSPAGAVSVVVRGATLIGVSRPASGLLPSSATTTVVTVGVTDLAEAEAVVQASREGTVELVQAQPSDGTGLGPAPGG